METDTKAMVVAMVTIPVFVTVATFALAYPAETAATVGACALLALYVWWHVGTFRAVAESAHLPTVAADESPLIWTREGLIDFFQLHDSMSAETFNKFDAIISDTAVVPTVAAVKPRIRVKAAVVPVAAVVAPIEFRKFETIISDLKACAAELQTDKPRVRVKAGSRHIHATAENTAVQAPEPETATHLAETTHTHTTAAHTAATAPRHGRVSYTPWAEYAMGTACILIMVGIGTSNAVAGMALRATLAIIPHYLGWIDADSFMSFGMSHLWKLI